jgi:hypothetical protein
MMKVFLRFAIGVGLATSAFGAVINISTGTNNANWQVSGPGIAVPITATSLTVAQQNGTWAPAPISISPISGANWVSFGSAQGTSCVVGQAPGNGCANALNNPSGDLWVYTLTISSGALGGATSGTLNFIFGADNRVNLFVGNEPGENWNGGSNTNGTGYNPLGCSGNPPTSAGNTQANYNNCVGTVSFNASDLIAGALTLTANVNNDPIPGCPTCGDPTGFVLEGTLAPNAASAVPEPATFGLMALAGLAGLALRRRR